MKNQIAIITLILILTSCNEQELTKENQNLINKLERKEELIRSQIKEIESKNSTIAILENKLTQLNKLLEVKPKKTLSELYNQVKSSVYLIYTESENGISQGSAFVIAKDGLAISNYHVFKNASKAVAINENNNRFLISEIIEENKNEDYIIFKLGPLSNSISYLEISNDIPKVGEDVFTVGNPNGLTQTLSTGIISNHRDNLIQTTTEITHGSSGGPLFNKYGQVIGITSSGIGEANLNFAINIKTLDLNKYLNSVNHTYTPKKIDNRNLVAIINGYYSSIINEDYFEMGNYYTEILSRYHTLYSIDKERAIKDKKDYLSKFKVISANIIDNTFQVYKNDSNYTIQCQIQYNLINRKNKKEKSFLLNSVFIINKNGKIKSIYENILKRY